MIATDRRASGVHGHNDLTYADLDTLVSAVPAVPSKTNTIALTDWT